MTFITMSDKEAGRYEIINDLIGGSVNGSEAAKQLGLSVRQTKRIKARVKDEGLSGVIHKNRGRESSRRTKDEIIDKVKKLLHEKYSTCKPTFASEKLSENDNIKLSKETVRSLMIKEELWKVRPRKSAGKKRHVWRKRKDSFGEMQQFDGSYHVWFGEDETCLLASIDDATGRVTHARFGLNESTEAVFGFWLEYIDKHGFPLSIYLDKYSTYKINHKNAVDNKNLLTQFQRAMNQVGVKTITAHSPQAKGRVERVFGTLQDRLVQELRLADITDTDEANDFLDEYLPKFNAKFGVVPERKKDLHKKVPKQIEEKLAQIFSIQNSRVVQNDYTVMFKTNYYQLDEIQPTTVYKKDKITVEERLDGSIKLRLRDKYLDFHELPHRPKKVIDLPLPAITTHKSAWKPPANHPWRRQFLLSKMNKQKQPKKCRV